MQLLEQELIKKKLNKYIEILDEYFILKIIKIRTKLLTPAFCQIYTSPHFRSLLRFFVGSLEIRYRLRVSGSLTFYGPGPMGKLLISHKNDFLIFNEHLKMESTFFPNFLKSENAGFG